VAAATSRRPSTATSMTDVLVSDLCRQGDTEVDTLVRAEDA
jgi:hypothetical protein